MNFFEISNNSLFFRCDGETVKISPWGKDSLRVQSTILCDIPEGEVALTPTPAPTFTEIHIENERQARITIGKISAKLFVQEWGDALRITFTDKNGKTLLSEISNGGALTRKPRKFRPLPGDCYKITATFDSDRNEKIYGMGQYQQEIFNLKGCNLELAHRNSQASIPFYLSSLGYGFLWHNASIGEVHFGLNTTEWVAECSEKLDYWITAGDSPKEIMGNYTSVTGRAPKMPEYGLGFWQCKLRYYNQEQVLAIAREYKRRNIPIDVLVIDYYHWPRCGDWRFDEEYFPDPKKMVDELKEMGIELMVSIWPQVDWRSENYEEMKRQGLLVKINQGVDVQMTFHGNNVFLDPTNPRTRKYVWQKVKEHYADLGIKVFWLDEAEPEFTGYDFDSYRYSSGPVAKIGNIYPREYSRLFYEGQKENSQDDIVNLVRCAWVGSQKYGALVWSGDIWSNFEDFRKQICAGLHMGISGIPWWTTDIGGFHGGNIYDEDFRELLVRWFEFGTFLPVMRLHGLRQPFTKIIDKKGEEREHTGADNEIWSFGEVNYEILKKYVFIRELLRPYLRTVMDEAHESGYPVMRTLFYEFPDDKKTWDIQDEFLLGSDILIAPVCHKGETKRKVYLPEGVNWTEAHTAKIFEGGKEYEIYSPIDAIPVFLREGKQDYLIGKI